jgi:hypothetical protein
MDGEKKCVLLTAFRKLSIIGRSVCGDYVEKQMQVMKELISRTAFMFHLLKYPCGNLPQSSFTPSASLQATCRLANQLGA